MRSPCNINIIETVSYKRLTFKHDLYKNGLNAVILFNTGERAHKINKRLTIANIYYIY